jgi:predicted enzyme related to lactoylglutathione lyase
VINRYVRNLVLWAILLAVVLYFFLPQLRTPKAREEITYSQFLTSAQAGRIADVTISDDAITGHFKDGQPFRTFAPPNDASYLETLRSRNAQITVEPKSKSALWPSLLSTMLPYFLLIGLWLLMRRQAQSGTNQARVVMDQGIRLFVYPVKDLTGAKALYGKLLGTEPYAEGPYYVGFRVGDQEIGLDPTGHKQGMMGPIGYVYVKDIKKSRQQLLDAGARIHQEIKDVGGGRLIATVKDADGNIIGLVQSS